MARAIISPEFQIQRINKLRNELELIRKKGPDRLRLRPSEKSWSAAEVARHMVLAHLVYIQKVEQALSRLPKGNQVVDEVRAGFVASFLIKRFPPKDGNIRMKMKTMQQFEPVFSREELAEIDVDGLFDEFQATLTELKSWVENYRLKQVEKERFASAVGAWVKFNVAEACEFILCHNERHLLQMQRSLKN